MTIPILTGECTNVTGVTKEKDLFQPEIRPNSSKIATFRTTKILKTFGHSPVNYEMNSTKCISPVNNEINYPKYNSTTSCENDWVRVALV